MTTSNVKRSSLRYVPAAFLVLLSVGACVSQEVIPSENGCDHVDIRLAYDHVKGEVGIRHDKIAGFSRMRGLTGPIVYVGILPPTETANKAEVRRMTLWWDDHPSANTFCRVGPDISLKPAINCTQSVAGTQLRLDVTFEPSARDTEMRTSKLAKYVSSDVVCPLD